MIAKFCSKAGGEFHANFVVFEKSRCFFSPSKFDLFSKIVQITSKYAQNYHIKNNQKNCENGQKRGKIVVFLALEVRILTLFSHFFANHL